MKLFTTYYDEKNPNRRLEYAYCLTTNDDVFRTCRGLVTVLAQDAPVIPSDIGFTGRWLNTDRRQKYSDLFAIAREICEPEDLCIIANADIVFNSDCLCAMNIAIKSNEAYCLTRWDLHDGMSFYGRDYSQDVWVFRGPPRDATIRSQPLGCYGLGGGLPGCDNKLAWDLREAGYTVLNPSLTVKTWHLHKGDPRRRTSSAEKSRLPRPYLCVKPHRIGEQPEYRELL